MIGNVIPIVRVLGVYAAVLFTQGLTNTFGVEILHHLNNISIWWHAVGTTAVVIAILAKAPTHQSASWVFQQFIDGTGVDGAGWGDRAGRGYVVVIGVRGMWFRCRVKRLS